MTLHTEASQNLYTKSEPAELGRGLRQLRLLHGTEKTLAPENMLLAAAVNN